MGRLLPSLDAYLLFRKLLHGFVIKLRCQDTERASAESFDNPLPRQPHSIFHSMVEIRMLSFEPRASCQSSITVQALYELASS